jgi:hypothetical protein
LHHSNSLCRYRHAWLVSLLFAGGACTEGGSPATSDGSVANDAGAETGDAPLDANDGGSDATLGHDAGPDVTADAGLDVVGDVAAEASDAALDAGDATAPEVAVSDAADAASDAATGGRTWHSIFKISNAGFPGGAGTPSSTFDGAGGAIATWSQTAGAGTGFTVHARPFAPSTGWGTDTTLRTTSTTIVATSLGVDATGRAIAAWAEGDGSTPYSVWLETYAPGSGWSPPTQVGADLTGVVDGVVVVMNPSGKGLVAWVQSDTTTNGYTRVVTYAPASGFSAVSSIQVATTQPFGPPSAAINAAGVGVVAWTAQDTVSAVYARTFGTSADATSRMQADTSGGWDLNPYVAIGSDGTVVGAWERYDQPAGGSPKFRIRGSRLPSGATAWDGPTILDSNPTLDSRAPRVAVDGSGNAIAVFQQVVSGATGNTNIFANRFDAVSKSWGTATALESTGPATDNYPSLSPDVAFDSSGKAIAAWQDDGQQIFTALYTPGVGFAAAIDPIVSGDPVSQMPSAPPRVSFDTSGRALVYWAQREVPSAKPTQLTPQVWGARYE